MAMGVTPSQVWEMSFWEFGMAVEGWRRANGQDTTSPPTADEHDEMIRKYG